MRTKLPSRVQPSTSAAFLQLLWQFVEEALHHPEHYGQGDDECAMITAMWLL